tara:strand:+ start:1290 stop:1556 length:267 start_codon:yes stop_codon:yes gene_type:complete
MKNITDTLKNGFRILAIHRSNLKSFPVGVVLASDGRQFATWLFSDNDTDTTYGGNYFFESQTEVNDPEGEAMQDYINRIKIINTKGAK